VVRENSKVEYTYGWYSASAGNKLNAKVMTRKIRHKAVRGNAPTYESRFGSSYFLRL
jgi:hypothetical protein